MHLIHFRLITLRVQTSRWKENKIQSTNVWLKAICSKITFFTLFLSSQNNFLCFQKLFVDIILGGCWCWLLWTTHRSLTCRFIIIRLDCTNNFNMFKNKLPLHLDVSLAMTGICSLDLLEDFNRSISGFRSPFDFAVFELDADREIFWAGKSVEPLSSFGDEAHTVFRLFAIFITVGSVAAGSCKNFLKSSWSSESVTITRIEILYDIS